MLVNNVNVKEKLNQISGDDIVVGAYFTSESFGKSDILIIEVNGGYTLLNAKNFVVAPLQSNILTRIQLAEWLNKRGYYSLDVKIVEDK